jgi:hypothetical protein
MVMSALPTAGDYFGKYSRSTLPSCSHPTFPTSCLTRCCVFGENDRYLCMSHKQSAGVRRADSIDYASLGFFPATQTPPALLQPAQA